MNQFLRPRFSRSVSSSTTLRPQILVIFTFVLLALLWPAPIRAQEPTPTPNFNDPYDFQPVDLDAPANPALTGLGEMIASVSFINRFGSIAVTVWSILDNFAGGGVLAIFVIILLGVVMIRWVASFVYNKPISEKLDGGAVADVAGDIDPGLGRSTRRFINVVKNRPRF